MTTNTKRLPKSLRQFIRREKARIRREVTDPVELRKRFDELYRALAK